MSPHLHQIHAPSSFIIFILLIGLANILPPFPVLHALKLHTLNSLFSSHGDHAIVLNGIHPLGVDVPYNEIRRYHQQLLFNIYWEPAVCWAHTATKTFRKKTCSGLKSTDYLIKSDSPIRGHRGATVSLGVCMFLVEWVGVCPPLRSHINAAAGLLQE